MRVKNILKLTVILGSALLLLNACEDEYSDVGSNIVDNDNFEANLFESTEINANSHVLERVQTNELSSYQLGIYDDPTYGKTQANVLAQLSLSQTSPKFGTNPEMDSVVLSVPYYSTVTEQTEDGDTYKLDSVYGKTPIKLSLYKSNYFLRSVDPNDDYEAQAYYSDQGDLFEENIENSPFFTESEFVPSKKEFKYHKLNASGERDTTLSRLTPRLRLKLPTQMFQEQVLDQEGSSNLLSNANFQNYFRGIYFKAESTQGDKGVLSLLDFRGEGAKITLYYTYEDSEGEDKSNSYSLSFGQNIVNVFNNEEQIPSDDDLYVKGGQGSMAIVDLFTNQQQLDSIRDLNWLVNDANLKFYVNNSKISEGDQEPHRLFIYDLKNNRVLSDYAFDTSTNENDPYNSKVIHLGPLSTDDDGNRYYKIRLTGYISDVINRDSTNTKLGLVVSQNVNIPNLLKTKVKGAPEVEEIPSSAIISQQGTVLYGTEASQESKKLKLEIYYTKPE